MITKGTATDYISSAIVRIQEEESKGTHGKLKFFAIGVSDYKKEFLQQLTKRVLALDEIDFDGIFEPFFYGQVQIELKNPFFMN